MIKTAIVGVGNCASALVQGVNYCKGDAGKPEGILFPNLGGYAPDDIEFVAAFDVDVRKVGKPLADAIFASPNNTLRFHDGSISDAVSVSRGAVLDGVSPAMRGCDDLNFQPIDEPGASKDEVVSLLKDTGTEVVINFLPVGSQQATEFYAECALEAGAAFVNAIPVFLASNPDWSERYRAAGIPLLGDDIKAQIGATITHRVLADLFKIRGAELDRSYQLNVGGNTDFLNMMDKSRTSSKRTSKTESVQSAARERFEDKDLRIGPSDYVPWLEDEKVAFIRMEGRLFGGAPVNLEMRLSVVDSPNAAAMAIAAIRCARVARDKKISGSVSDVSAFLFKHPPEQIEDHEAHSRLMRFCGINGD